MTTAVPFSTGLGEVLTPGMLVAACILAPDGTLTIDPGALHGRSQFESGLRFVPRRDQVPNPQAYWFIWVGIELDAANRPVRYTGLGASECLVDQGTRTAYKSVAEAVNRMSDVLESRVQLKALGLRERTLIARQLRSLDPGAWGRSTDTFRRALES